MTRTCTKYVKNIEGVSLWDGRVLIYNSTSYVKGLVREKIMYIGQTYIISVANESHVIVYVSGIGSYPLFSKGIFIHIDPIAIYSRENAVKPQVVYRYLHAEGYPIQTRRFYYPIAKENQMIYLIARLPTFLPHFWIEDLVDKRTIIMTNVTIGRYRESIEMSFIGRIDIGNRTLWLAKFIFSVAENSRIIEIDEVYVCIDAGTKLPIARIFIGEEKSIEYLVGTAYLNQVPKRLLSELQGTIYVNALTNRSIEIPKPRVATPNINYDGL
ncbi:MAG: hypothetical protein QXM62_06555 [Ignisphaera sp.]